MSSDAYFRTILALLFVLGLVLACSWVLRRYSAGGMPLSRAAKRLAIVEMMSLDPKHRLVLIRRDDTEHLLLLAPNHDLLIESGIRLAAKAGSFAAELSETAR